MFKQLKELLLSLLVKFSETKYLRVTIIALIIIPLVITMYGYIDDVIFDTKSSLKSISDYSLRHEGKTFPLGSLMISYMSVAKIPECLTSIFTWITYAIVWSFTYDLQPMFTRK